MHMQLRILTNVATPGGRAPSATSAAAKNAGGCQRCAGRQSKRGAPPPPSAWTLGCPITARSTSASMHAGAARCSNYRPCYVFIRSSCYSSILTHHQHQNNNNKQAASPVDIAAFDSCSEREPFMPTCARLRFLSSDRRIHWCTNPAIRRIALQLRFEHGRCTAHPGS